MTTLADVDVPFTQNFEQVFAAQLEELGPIEEHLAQLGFDSVAVY
jgi:hypothetical protein